jgi:hypothetical protein
MQTQRQTVMRSSYIKNRLEIVETSVYVLMQAARSRNADPMELSDALRLVLDGIDHAKGLIDEMIDELERKRGGGDV